MNPPVFVCYKMWAMEGKSIRVRIRPLSPNGRVPERSHEGDAGWDLFSAEDVTIPPGDTAVVSTDVSMEIPRGWYGQIKSRSGLGTKGVVVTAGVVDSTYRGNIKVVIINCGKKELVFKRGDKLAQMVFLPVPEVEFVVADSLEGSERGDRGFGSTGL